MLEPASFPRIEFALCHESHAYLTHSCTVCIPFWQNRQESLRHWELRRVISDTAENCKYFFSSLFSFGLFMNVFGASQQRLCAIVHSISYLFLVLNSTLVPFKLIIFYSICAFRHLLLRNQNTTCFICKSSSGGRAAAAATASSSESADSVVVLLSFSPWQNALCTRNKMLCKCVRRYIKPTIYTCFTYIYAIAGIVHTPSVFERNDGSQRPKINVCVRSVRLVRSMRTFHT